MQLKPLTLALILALAPAAQAANLSDTFRDALAYDAQYAAARAAYQAGQEKSVQGRAGLLPNVNMGGNVRYNDISGEAQDNSFDSNQLAIRASQPVFRKQNMVAYAQSKEQVKIAEMQFKLAEQDLILRVAQAYFDVLQSQDNIAFINAQKAAITEQLAAAKRNFEVGTATITDTREAQAKADLAAAQQIAAENDLINRRIALAYLVGRRDIEPLPLASPVVLPTIVPKNVEEWVTVADTVHPQVVRARTALEVAKLEIAKSKAGELPTIDAVASLGANYATGDSIIPGTTRSGSVGVELNWPLYTGGSVQNRIKETVALEQRSREEFENARRTVAQNTRIAYWGVQSGEALVKALEAAEASSRLSLDATQLGYKVGVRVNIDVLNAQTQLFQTQRDLFKSRYDVLVNSLRLRQASGQLTPNDLLAVNSLLAR